MPSKIKGPRPCVYCGHRTKVDPRVASAGSGQLARYPHSPSRLKFPPLCEATKQGQRALARVLKEATA